MIGKYPQVGLILGALVAVALTGCAGYAPGRQAYWDERVAELCRKDGGARVLEKVSISQEEFERLGGAKGVISIPSEANAGTAPYFSRSSTEELNANPRVIRRETHIVRRRDGKVLAKQVSYSRIGGDFPTGIAHPSVFSCRDLPEVRLDVEEQLFVIRGASK